jgi:hypothetical protein
MTLVSSKDEADTFDKQSWGWQYLLKVFTVDIGGNDI